jgi:serine/threonine protein kinase/Tfp pilus assembly protein PilF
MTLSPGSKLGPYEILSSIGSGGMGEVWKARDTRLGRIVAIKKVKEQHSDRFKQEARSIAALNHPNICQIFDIGDDYLVLEYVEGKPLSSPLPEQEAVRLAIQIATALEEAHQHGIIHRDLKPSNIMMTDKGSVKLLDFGLAKLYEQDQSTSNLPTEDFPATQVGAILGTVAYMSPEQAQGQPADARSDIFSFGLVLYEMLSGRRAFSGDSNFTVMTAIVNKEPDSVQASPQLEKIVKRCLEKKPAERYQTMAELKAALEKAVKPKVAAGSESPQPSIAVLPFVNMSGDKEQEYFSDGLAEEIINALTKIPSLKVAGRTSSFYFRDKDVEFAEIGKKLNVEHILEGSVRKSGNRLRVTAQLIKVADGFHLWSERYDRELTDVFIIQDEISQAIAEKLSVQFLGDRPSIKRHTDNIEAYNLYLKGHYQLHKYTAEGLGKSKEYLEKAIAIDPNYALAWFGLAETDWYRGFISLARPKIANEHARKATLKALELNEMLPEAHAMKAILHFSEFDWKEVEREFQRALKLSKESPFVWWTYSLFYFVPMRRFDEAIVAAQNALELDPLSPLLHWQLGHRYFYAEKYDRSIEEFQNTLEIDPQYNQAHSMLGMIYCLTGKTEEGIKAFEKSIALGGSSSIFLAQLAMAYFLADRIDDSKNLLNKLLDLAQKEYVSPMGIAYIYILFDEKDKAFDWLERAYEERDGMIMNIHVVPLISNPLRSHPRYKALLRKMNLEP